MDPRDHVRRPDRHANFHGSRSKLTQVTRESPHPAERFGVHGCRQNPTECLGRSSCSMSHRLVAANVHEHRLTVERRLYPGVVEGVLGCVRLRVRHSQAGEHRLFEGVLLARGSMEVVEDGTPEEVVTVGGVAAGS